jgi:hypothetical protein
MNVTPTEFRRFSLRLEESSGRSVASSEGGGIGDPGVMVYKASKDGVFRIVVMGSLTTTGKYVLKMRQLDPEPDRTKIHDLGKDGLEFGSTLHRDTTKGELGENPAKVYRIRLGKGKTYTFDMTSSAFRGELRVQDSTGKNVGGGFSGPITFQPPQDGTYQIIATSRFVGTFRGVFVLKMCEKQ